jgi:hypothetical protein
MTPCGCLGRTGGYTALTIELFITIYRDWNRPDDAAKWRERGFEHVQVMRRNGAEKPADDFEAVLREIKLVPPNRP